MSDLLDAVETNQEHVVITRNGRPIVVLLSVDEWEAVEETLDVLADAELLRDLEASEQDVAAGRLFSLDEVRRELGLA